MTPVFVIPSMGCTTSRSCISWQQQMTNPTNSYAFCVATAKVHMKIYISLHFKFLFTWSFFQPPNRQTSDDVQVSNKLEHIVREQVHISQIFSFVSPLFGLYLAEHVRRIFRCILR